MSWLSLAVVALVVAICESEGNRKTCDCNFVVPRGYGQSTAAEGALKLLKIRVDSQTQKLARESIDFHNLQTETNKILSSKGKYAKRIKQLRRRIALLEGTGCAKDQFSCNDGSQRCISNLLVCDGVDDCNNHADEDKKRCELPVVGSQMVAHPKPEDSGCNWVGRQATTISITVKKVTTNVYLPGRPQLDLGILGTSITNRKSIEEYFSATGSWDPARRRFTLNPLLQYGPWGIICDFDGIDEDHCEGTFFNVYTHETCGFFTFTVTKKST